MSLDELDAQERAMLSQELFRLNQRIFVGVELKEFERLVINPSARWTRIQIMRNGYGEAVGYCAVHLFDLVLSDRAYAVFRAQAGILRPYRGEGATFAFGFREAIRYKLLHPLERVYFFSTPIHPAFICCLDTSMRSTPPIGLRPRPR